MDEAGDGEARASAGSEVGLPLCSVSITALSGSEFAPTLLEWKP